MQAQHYQRKNRIKLRILTSTGLNLLCTAVRSHKIKQLLPHIIKLYQQVKEDQGFEDEFQQKIPYIKSIRKEDYYIANSQMVGDVFDQNDQIFCEILGGDKQYVAKKEGKSKAKNQQKYNDKVQSKQEPKQKNTTQGNKDALAKTKKIKKGKKVQQSKPKDTTNQIIKQKSIEKAQKSKQQNAVDHQKNGIQAQKSQEESHKKDKLLNEDKQKTAAKKKNKKKKINKDINQKVSTPAKPSESESKIKTKNHNSENSHEKKKQISIQKASDKKDHIKETPLKKSVSQEDIERFKQLMRLSSQKLKATKI